MRDRLAVLHPGQGATGVAAADAMSSGGVHADDVLSDGAGAVVIRALSLVQNGQSHLVQHRGNWAEDAVIDLAPSRRGHHVSSVEGGRAPLRQTHGGDGVCPCKGSRQANESQVIVKKVTVPVWVLEEISGNHAHLGIFIFINHLGSSNDFNTSVSVSAMGSCENPFVADDGPAAEVHVVDEHANLPRELVRRCASPPTILLPENTGPQFSTALKPGMRTLGEKEAVATVLKGSPFRLGVTVGWRGMYCLCCGFFAAGLLAARAASARTRAREDFMVPTGRG